MAAAERGVIVESRSSNGTGVGAANAWRENAIPRRRETNFMMKTKRGGKTKERG